MGWGFLKKIAGGINTAVSAGKVVTALFPGRTKKLARYSDMADEVTDVANRVFGQVSFSPETIRSEAELVYKLDLSEDELRKIFEYLKRNFEQNKQATLGSLADERRREQRQ